MAMANQPTPPWGASAERVGRGRCARVLYNFIIRLRKNNLRLLPAIYFIFSMLLITIAPTIMTLHPQHDHPQSNLLSCITYLMSVSFWLAVVFTIITWWPSKAKLYFICDYFFCPSNCCPKRWDNFPHLL